MAADRPDQGEKDVTWSREAAEAWHRAAAARNERWGPATDAMLDLAGVVAGSRVLDVAAGTGDQTLLAARRVGPSGSVLATDIAPDMLDIAAGAVREAGLANVETRVMDAQRLDLESDSFDKEQHVMPMPVYFPGPVEQWERRAPEQVGLDPDLLATAVEFAAQHETPWSTDSVRCPCWRTSWGQPAPWSGWTTAATP